MARPRYFPRKVRRFSISVTKSAASNEGFADFGYVVLPSFTTEKNPPGHEPDGSDFWKATPSLKADRA